MKLKKNVGYALGTIAVAMLFGCGGGSGGSGGTNVSTPSLPTNFSDRCAQAATLMSGYWPDSSTRIERATYHVLGEALSGGGTSTLPNHCEIMGVTQERKGVDGQNYAIRFRLRLPEVWTKRLLFQGGGGTNGSVGDAIGDVGGGAPNALSQGYAVLAQDSGHNNDVNSDPAHGGGVAFGFDPEARANYGGVSLKTVTLAAKAAIGRLYSDKGALQHSYFVGCSKGGQEGMMLAQRYPDLYDGVIATAPGFSLPKAALAEAWNTKAFAQIAIDQGVTPSLSALGKSFSVEQGQLVRQAILDACDADDGVVDGMIYRPKLCTTAKVLPELQKLGCARHAGTCLADSQITALVAVHDGVRNSANNQLYPGFPWDSDWLSDGWRGWMTGPSDGSGAPMNVWLGASSRSVLFSTPPVVPSDVFQYQINFDADRDGPSIFATTVQFIRSAWEDVGARSSDLSVFKQRGGKIIVPHGLSDPVFSAKDTMDWWDEVNTANAGHASDFARVYLVPGMEHCGGGAATDNFDAFSALVKWVEQGSAPDKLEATAGWGTPWPGRSRPLCPYPSYAKADTTGGTTSFMCVAD